MELWALHLDRLRPRLHQSFHPGSSEGGVVEVNHAAYRRDGFLEQLNKLTSHLS